MIWIVGFPLLAVVMFWGEAFDYSSSTADYVFSSMFLLFVAFSGFIVGLVVGKLVGMMLPQEEVEHPSKKLAALRGLNTVSGSFFLGTGSMDARLFYFYYVEVGENAYQLEKIEVSENVTIFEEDRKDGELTEVGREFTCKWLDWFGIPSFKTEYEFSIPEGSIKRDFNL